MNSKTETICPKCGVYWLREIIGETHKGEPIFAYTFLTNEKRDKPIAVWDCPNCKPDSWINCRKDKE